MTDQEDTEHDSIESDIEREHIGVNITDHLDSIAEIMDNSNIDVEEDEQFIEISDLLQRIRDIINEG